MAQKKYVSLSKLSTFLDNLNRKFASISHKHSISDISDFSADLSVTVDSELSDTSTNPVQNKVINAEFDAISVSMNALESAVDNHNHDDAYDAFGASSKALEEANVYTDNAVAQKAQVQIITWGADD